MIFGFPKNCFGIRGFSKFELRPTDSILYIRGYSVGTKDKRQLEKMLRLDHWSCTYAKWMLSQFGIILDKYLIKREREVSIKSE